MNPKVFFSRWGEGIKSVTPYQHAKINFASTFIVLFGLVLGIIVNVRVRTWWLVIVLSGVLIMTCLSQIMNYQKLLVLKKLDVLQSEEGGFLNGLEE